MPGLKRETPIGPSLGPCDPKISVGVLGGTVRLPCIAACQVVSVKPNCRLCSVHSIGTFRAVINVVAVRWWGWVPSRMAATISGAKGRVGASRRHSVRCRRPDRPDRGTSARSSPVSPPPPAPITASPPISKEHHETSASVSPGATVSGSYPRLPMETVNRTTRVLPNPDNSCATDTI